MTAPTGRATAKNGLDGGLPEEPMVPVTGGPGTGHVVASDQLFNPETTDGTLTAFYENGAHKTLESWLAGNGLKKSPSGHTGSTSPAGYMQSEPYLPVQQPPGTGSTADGFGDDRGET